MALVDSVTSASVAAGVVAAAPAAVPGVLFDVPGTVELVDDEWLARHPEPPQV